MKPKKIFFLLIFVIFSGSIWSQIMKPDEDLIFYKTESNFFIENKGQWPEEVLFLAQLGGLNYWITRNGMVMDFFQVEGKEKMVKQYPARMFDDRIEEGIQVKGHVVKMKWVGSDIPRAEGRGKREDYYNYFIGNDSSRWGRYVGLYDELLIRNLYPGVDLRYYFDGGYVRFDFLLAPGVDPATVRWEIEGADEVEVVENELRFRTRFGWVSLMDLKAFQANDEIMVNFKKNGKFLEFDVHAYNVLEALVIDPLIYSTFIGKSGQEKSNVIKIDSDGNVYIAGYTSSTNYPTTVGSYDVSYNGGNSDAFVTKLNSSGSALVYSTFLGGSSYDWIYDLKVDTDGNVFVTGSVTSTNYPVTSGAYDVSHNGGNDVFVTKLNTTGSDLVYSTFLGGSSDEDAFCITVDGSGNVYVTGQTKSSNYPVTSGVIDESFNGGTYDVFVTKLNSSGNGLLYSTFLGGSSNDGANSITIDAVGNAYITGNTSSANYPVTFGSYDATHNGGSDVFITKINSTGSSVWYSTFLGGNNNESGTSLAIDASGNIHVVGYTTSTDYPVTTGAYDGTHNGNTDVFVTKLNSSGSGLLYSTFIGGNADDYGYSIALDGSGNMYMTGYTNSADYPVTACAYDGSINGGSDIFVTKINSMGNSLLYSTFVGGNYDDQAFSLTINDSNNVYITGFTSSSNFPVTGGAYDITNDGNWDVFVTKIGIEEPSITLTSGTGSDNQMVCVNTAITNIIYNATCASDATFSGLPAGVNGIWNNSIVTISGTPTMTGTYIYTVTLTGTNVSATGTIQVNPVNTILLSTNSGSDSQVLCVNTPITDITYNSTGATGATFSGLPAGVNGTWNNGIITISGTPTVSGTYQYTVTLTGGCGNISTTGTIVVNQCTGLDEANGGGFELYPNPTDRFIYLRIYGYEDLNVEVKVTEIRGREVYSGWHEVKDGRVDVWLGDFPEGMYFVRFAGDNWQHVKKVVVKH